MYSFQRVYQTTKNQLSFLVDAKPEEVSAEREAEEVTNVADSAVQATNVLETEFGEPIELTKEEDIAQTTSSFISTVLRLISLEEKQPLKDYLG